MNDYRQVSNISRTKIQNLNVSRRVLLLSLCNILKPGVKFEYEDVVGAAPPGDATTKSEWSTIVLPTKVRLIRGFNVYLETIFTIELWIFVYQQWWSIIRI